MNELSCNRVLPSEDSFDSEVISLVEDLGLVLKGSLEHLTFLAIQVCKKWREDYFKESYFDDIAHHERNVRWRMREYYLMNKKWSKHVYKSYRGKEDITYCESADFFGFLR